MTEGMEMQIGEAIGMRKGKEEGLSEGEAIGMRKVAIEMKAKGIDLNFISEITKLPVEEIEKL